MKTKGEVLALLEQSAEAIGITKRQSLSNQTLDSDDRSCLDLYMRFIRVLVVAVAEFGFDEGIWRFARGTWTRRIPRPCTPSSAVS
jgi:hypothetical protein